MIRRTVALITISVAVLSACGSGGFSGDADSASEAGPLPSPAPYPDVSFQNPGLNPLVDTATDPRSTFALDVDTGSYTIARRFLRDGNLPIPDSVRVEEYVNYFQQDYPPPSDGPFAIHTDGAPTPFVDGASHRLVRIGLQSQRIDDQARKDASLTFVIDTSGSMEQEGRLELVKDSLELLVDRLRPEETIGIVAYGSTARIVLAPTSVSQRELVLDAIDQLQPEGSTNAEDGLHLGYQVARASFRPGWINRVVLASDGVANVGNTGPDAILSTIGTEAKEGIDLVTLGFGMGNYNDVLMEQLADHGDGFYAYIDDLREAERLFSQELTSTLQTVAEEAKVQVQWDPAVVPHYRLLGFENRAIADDAFRNEQLGTDAGEIGAGHSVTALYEVELAPGAAATLGTVSLRWTDPDSGQVRELAHAINPSDLATTFEAADLRLQLDAAVAEWAELLRDSSYAGQETLEGVDTVAARLRGDLDGDTDVAEFADLVSRSVELSS